MNSASNLMCHRIIIALLICLPVSSCGVYTKYLGSKPIIGESDVWTHRIKLDGMDLNVRTYNDVRDFQMWNSIVFVPVYISGKDEPVYEQTSNFKVLFSYLPNEKGFSLDPNKIVLIVDDERFDATVLTEWWNPVPRRGNSWTGYCGPPVPDSYQRISYEEFSDEEMENWHCYQLQFGLPPPHPSKKFGLSITGFKKDGSNYEVPDIWFEEYIWQQSDSVP